MSNKVRKILFGSFMALFFILAGVTLPYAFGYKLNFTGWKLQRTGMFDIKTTPGGAAIYLNGRQQVSWLGQLTGRPLTAATPVKLKNITPGTYQVRLELDGYWPWEKQLVINPGATTYLEDVYLFKKSQPRLLLAVDAADIKNAVASPDRKYLAVLTGVAKIKTELRLFAWDKITEPQAIALPRAAEELRWSPDGQKIACGNLVIDRRDNSLTDLQTLGVPGGAKLVWADDETLYWQDKTAFKKITLTDKQIATVPLNQTAVSDFTFKDGYLYLIRRGQPNELVVMKLNANETKEALTVPLKQSENYVFINWGQNQINLQETASKKLYAVSTKLPWLKDYTLTEIPAVTAGQWIGDNKLIFANGFELSLWTSTAGQTKLLTRVSHQIAALTWHKSNNYIIFATDGTINTLELDDRYTYNITTLLSAEKIAYPIFNHDGNGVFFWSAVNGQNGFYLLEI